MSANTVEGVIYSVLEMKKLNLRRIKSLLKSTCPDSGYVCPEAEDSTSCQEIHS